MADPLLELPGCEASGHEVDSLVQRGPTTSVAGLPEPE